MSPRRTDHLWSRSSDDQLGRTHSEREAHRDRRDTGDRGVSDVVAIAVLVGLVLSGAVLVAAVGFTVVDDARDRSSITRAIDSLEAMDGRLSTMAHRGGGETSLAFGTDRPSRFTVEKTGSITIDIDGDTCTATLPLTAVTFPAGGETLTYEAGGIWRSGRGGTALLSPPDLTYEGKTVRVNLLNVSGRVDRSAVAATVSGPRGASDRSVGGRLFDRQQCVRPDGVEITVRSDRYRAWGRYLADEFGLALGSGVHIDRVNRSATVTIDQKMLPREADDGRNEVVDFVSGYGQQRAGTFSVEKGDPGLTYPVSITVLGGDRQGGHATETIQRNRLPVDVAFVLDESSSMEGEKLSDTQSAAVGFVDNLQTAEGDRVAVVGYSDVWGCGFGDWCPSAYLEDARVHSTLSTDVEDTVRTIEDDLWAYGRTPMAAGLNRTTDLFVEEGEASNQRVAILLTDGRHNGDGNVTAAAHRAAQQNVTVYAVGFGSDVDEPILREVANATGGRYYQADDAAELRDRFEDIATEVSKTRSVRAPPETIQVGSRTLAPDGTVHDGPPNATVDNFKEPSLSGPATIGMDLQDGASLPVTLSTWHCDRWQRTNETVHDPNGTAYRKARCVAATGPGDPINSTVAAGRIRAITAANTTSDLPKSPDSWVESNVTEILRTRGYIDDGSLDLESNQVILLYDLPYGATDDGDFNDEILVVEIGHSTDDVSATYAVSVTVHDVRLDGK